MFEIVGKNIIVTGGNRGNGLEISKSLISKGANVIRIDKSFDNEIGADDFKIDLLNLKKINPILKKIISQYKTIDGLVNNAGVSLSSPNPYKDIESYNKTMNINLNSIFIFTSTVCSSMKDNKIKGSIINITSLGADMAFSNNPSYQVSKSGLKQLTKAFAIDWGKYGIRVNNIAPGYMITKMTEKSFNKKNTNILRKNRTMLGRWGKPEDLSGAIIFLLSDASSYITAAEIKVDGGWSSYGI